VSSQSGIWLNALVALELHSLHLKRLQKAKQYRSGDTCATFGLNILLKHNSAQLNPACCGLNCWDEKDAFKCRERI
jgi:hypothetical protein